MTQDHTIRDGMIHNAVEARRADETKILAKINLVNRQAFLAKFPGQLEHEMRLISERLMHILSKPKGVELDRPETWLGSPDDILSLCRSLESLDRVRENWPLTPHTQDQDPQHASR